MGILDQLLGRDSTFEKKVRCSRCHRVIKSNESTYERFGQIYCKECAEEEDFWDELDFLEDIDEDW
ncbi:MAG: hypothetical protein J6D29_01420 [Solobacterium sp.]|nr:hypothetical protein [Solobacterium sp.]